MKIKRRTFLLVAKWVIRVAIVSVLFGAWYGYARTSFFVITSYDIRGVDDDSRVSIDSKLHDAAKQKTWGLFSNDKILTYSKKSVINVVHTVATDADTISVRAAGLHTVKIVVTSLTPVLQLHPETHQVITNDGIIFTTKNDIHKYPIIDIASSTVRTITRKGLPMLQLMYKDDAIDRILIEKLVDFSSKVSSIIFPVATIVVSPVGDVSFIDERGMSKVEITEDADSKKVWSTLVSSIDTDPLKSRLANSKDGLEYLDVRFGNKVFYKFYDETLQNGTSTAILEPYESTPSDSFTSATSSR